MSPGPRKLTVFVSSTSEDLRDYRAVARSVILDMHWQPEMMEHFGAIPDPTVQACYDKLAQCNLMLLIVAHRQGLFVAALGQILTQSGSWEHAARRLIGSTHQYVDYIHMMLYASLAESKVNNARELLDQRWARINRASWDARMRHGDESAWREMLIGYTVGEVTSAELIGTLEDDALFAKSAFAHLPLPRKGLLCEAYFYDAVLAKAAGQKDRMRESLGRTIDTQMRFYFEYKIAKYLLASDAPRVQTASR